MTRIPAPAIERAAEELLSDGESGSIPLPLYAAQPAER